MLQYVHHLLVNRVCLLLDAEQRAENICMQLLKKNNAKKLKDKGNCDTLYPKKQTNGQKNTSIFHSDNWNSLVCEKSICGC